MDSTDATNQGGSSSDGPAAASGGDTPVVGGSSGGGSTNAGLPLTTSQWNVKFQLQFAHPFQGIPNQNCGYLVVTLDLVAQGAAVKAFMGADGSMSLSYFARASEPDSLELSQQLVFDPSPNPCAITSYQFDTLTIHAVDSNNDGQFDRLEGSGIGSADVSMGDTEEEAAMTVAVSGVPDDSAPSVNSGSASNPLDHISLNVREPLKTAKLYLDNGGSPVLFEIPQPGDALIRLSSDRVLPFGQTWSLAGNAADFAGHPLTRGSTFSTLKDPGFFAQDGFEGPLSAVLTGNAKVIDQSFGFALPGGSHALFIAPEGSVTIHLANLSKGFGTLSLTFMRLYQPADAQDGPDPYLEVAAIGGTQRSTNNFGTAGPVTPTHNDQWKTATAPARLVLPLLETATDAVVRISAFTYGSPPYPPTALLIDDLTLQ